MQPLAKFKSASIAVVLLLLTSELLASDTWTTEEKTLEATYLFLTVIDWKQTRYIADHTAYFERNPFLKENPSRREVDRFFIAATGAHLIVVDALPHRWRVPVQWFTIAEKSYNIWRNRQIGIKIEF